MWEARASVLATKTLHWVLPPDLPVDAATATGAIVEGTLLRAWSYAAKRKTPQTPDPQPEALVIVGGDAAAAAAAESVANAVNWARTQQHEPPNVLTPPSLAAAPNSWPRNSTTLTLR